MLSFFGSREHIVSFGFFLASIENWKWEIKCLYDNGYFVTGIIGGNLCGLFLHQYQDVVSFGFSLVNSTNRYCLSFTLSCLPVGDIENGKWGIKSLFVNGYFMTVIISGKRRALPSPPIVDVVFLDFLLLTALLDMVFFEFFLLTGPLILKIENEKLRAIIILW